MATDYSLEVRRSVVAHLKSFGPLTALVSAARIYGEKQPVDAAWPFVRYGLSEAAPFDATGWDGSEHDVAIHAFANGPYTDAIEGISKQIIEAMKVWPGVPGTGIVSAEWIGPKTIVRDSPPEQEAKYHSIIRFAIAVAG